MVVFSWDKELETGIDLIDRQHMQIMIAANKLFVCRGQDEAQEQLRNCLHFLEGYINHHFREEEAFQLECNFEGYVEHCAQHATLSATLHTFVDALSASPHEETELTAFYDFVMDWVRTHILQEDLRFAQTFRRYKERLRVRR